MPILPITFTTPGLPLATPLMDQIIADDRLFMWAQADAAHVTLAGAEIAAFTNVGSADRTFAAFSSVTRAGLVANQIAGRYAVAHFNGSTAPDDGASDVYTISSGALVADDPYAYAAVFRLDDADGGTTLLSRFTNASTRSLLTVPATNITKIALQHGTSQILGSLVSGWNYVIAGYDGANLQMICNGVTSTPVTASGSTGAAILSLGALNGSGSQAVDGDIADAMVFSADIFADDFALIIRDYFQTVYGL
jgi:hypothetical protein